MQLDFFPSRTLTLYLMRLFVTRILAVLVMLVLVLTMLDLLSESGTILQVSGNGQAQLLAYASLRAPQLAKTFLPYSVLLATLITLVTLNQNSEVVSMKAAGLSAHQILAPLVLAAVVVAGFSFAFNERVVTRATATLKAWQSVNYGPMPKDSAIKSNVYTSDGTNILSAATVLGTGNAMHMQNVTWYKRSPDGMIQQQIRAPGARYAAPGWLLTNATSFEVQSAATTEIPSIVVGTDITPQQVDLARIDPDSESFWHLTQSISRYEAAGRRTSELKAVWWHKLSGPLSSVLMPLLGSVAAFGLARSGQVFMRALIGMALGFGFFVIDTAALAMGDFGGYPPFLAAWGPFLLFLMIGETVLIRTEE